MKRFVVVLSLLTALVVVGLPSSDGSVREIALSAFGAVPDAAPPVSAEPAPQPTPTEQAPPVEVRPESAPTPSVSPAPVASPVEAPVPTPTPAPAEPAPAAAAPAVPACPSSVSGATAGAPSVSAGGGMISGTSSADLAGFATTYNEIRVANCLPAVPVANFRYDACMEQRLIWMAEDPSTDPASAWGHSGSTRSDGVPSVGCDGNLAGGSGNTGATVATKWWDSASHRASLYRPQESGSTAGVCIQFAMTHGGVPNETADFVRAAARWVSC